MFEKAPHLRHVLKPAGGGIHVVSTGVQELQNLQKRIYRCAHPDEIETAWLSTLAKLKDARAAILGVPSDTGAGFTRGANRAPGALREWLLSMPTHPIWNEGVCDIGDVYTVPQLLSEEMLSSEQRERTSLSLYQQEATNPQWPISPLGICRAILNATYQHTADVVPIVLGGDHSVGWPAFAAAFEHWEKHRGRRIGLLHFDAHTDLLQERLGVRYCFATWAYHANELLGRDGRLVQVGIRASGRTRAHWESSLNVRQYWADTAMAQGADAVADEIIRRFDALGVDALYVSNDIDGTDPAYASATGTPEPGGLTPSFVSKLTRTLAQRFPLVGADLVEVAPPLASNIEGEPDRTLKTASAYLEDFLSSVAI